jgi:hypothetical protein
MKALARSIVCVVGLLGVSSVQGQESSSFARHVRPFLAKYCVECHNAKAAKAGLNLDTFAALREGGDGGEVLEPGKPDDSRLVLLIEGKDEPIMPPKKTPRRPSRDEIARVRAWVAAGAKDDSASVKVVLAEIKPRQGLPAPVSALAYAADGKMLLIAAGAELRTIGGRPATYAGEIGALAISPQSTIMALGLNAAGARGSVAIYQGKSAREMRQVPPDVVHKDAILDLALSHDGKLLATASYDTQVKLIDTATGSERHTLKEHSDAVYGVAFSPDAKQLASCSADRAIKVWDTATGKLVYTLGESTDWLYAVAWSRDGRRLAAAGVDRSIRVYEPSPAGARLVQSVFAHEAPVAKLAFAPDSQTLYSVGQDRVVKAWDVGRMVERKVYPRQPDTVLSLAVAPDGKQIALGRYDGTVVLLDPVGGAVQGEIKGNEAAEKKQSFAPEQNAGNSPATGQKVALPVRIAGSLDRAGDVDFYRFEVKRGQQLGVRLAAAAGSKLEPTLQLCDLGGRVLAEGPGHLGHTFDAAGSFALGVRDREFRGGADMKYQLELGALPVVTAVFPLGLKRGTAAEVQVDGVHLDQTKVAVKVPADAAPGSTIPVPVTSTLGKPLGTAQVVVGEFPEVQSAGTLAVPGTGNGRLLTPGQMDVWSFAARRGERVLIETHAARIGSDLDSVLEVLDQAGQPVPHAVLRCQAKTYVTFRNHDSGQPGIRLEHWGELAMNDYLYVGSELMRIQALPLNPDADCSFWSSGGKRLGYLGTTPTHHSMGTPMYKVSIHPAGTTFSPNGFPLFTLFYRNDDGGPAHGRDSLISFDPPADGDYRIRVRDARGLAGPRFGYRLTVRPPRPDFAVRFAPTAPMVWKGGSIPLALTAERFDGFEGPIRVHFKNLPAGLAAPATTIEAETFTTALPVFAEPDLQLPAQPAPVVLVAEADIGGAKRVKEVTGEAPKLSEPGDIATTTLQSEIEIRPGGRVQLTVDIERRNGFTGRVPVEVRGLPHGVRVLDIGLNGILVTERETRRTITLQAEPWVQPAQRPIVVLARREGKNTEHGARPVQLRVVAP